jgi:1-acyl-sn-glycerol-3-phosphate acyltransferase
MTPFKALWRVLRTLVHVLAGLMTLLLRFPSLTAGQRQMRVQRWAMGLLACLGVKLEVRGVPVQKGPLMVIANHVSWLDIPALHAVLFCRFVAKADLHHWPVIGMMADRAGTLFIERESRRDAMRVVHHMADSLRANDVLAVFPEGTTSDGTGLLPFHANLFQAAISADVPVQPIHISYIDSANGQQSFAPNFVGDTSLPVSFWRTLQARGLLVRVHVGEAQPVNARDRRTMASHLRDAVAALARS